MRASFCLHSSFVLATLLTAACGASPPALPPIGEVAELSAPAQPGSSEAFLAAGADGTVYVSWLEPADASLLASASTRRGAFRLRFAALTDGAWSEPRTVAEGEHFSANWADFPTMLSLPDGTLAAHWLARSQEAGVGSGFWVSLSRDGGFTWTPARAAGPGGRPVGSFVALHPWTDGSLAAAWLEYPHERPADSETADVPQDGMILRHARFDATGAVVEERVLDALVCNCCQVGAALAEDGPVVVYRGRTRGEVRDIQVVRYANGRWTEPRPVHDDGWVIAACPVNGPAIAARGRDVVVAWFTAADDRPRVRVAFSADGGATFGTAHAVDDGDPLGRVDVEYLADGTALVSWLERTEADAEIRVRRFAASGLAGASRVVAAASATRPSGFPRMVRHGSELLFTWTEPGEPGHVRVARAGVPAAAESTAGVRRE
jgi:hypothetical protein